MADDAASELRRQLGDVKILDGLSAANSRKLLALMTDARAHQQAALEKALEGALSHIPMLLRGPVRKVLGL